ncbi:MAG: hypothetical protein JJD98_20200 [Polaromonas sp.]|nr:hypothetical protein [Polaromonas sp.]
MASSFVENQSKLQKRLRTRKGRWGVGADAIFTHPAEISVTLLRTPKTVTSAALPGFEVGPSNVGTWVNIASAPTRCATDGPCGVALRRHAQFSRIKFASDCTKI